MSDHVLIGLCVSVCTVSLINLVFLFWVTRNLLLLLKMHQLETKRRQEERQLDALDNSAFRLLDLKSQFHRRAFEQGLTNEQCDQLWSAVSAQTDAASAATLAGRLGLVRIHTDKALDLAVRVLENMRSTAAATPTVQS